MIEKKYFINKILIKIYVQSFYLIDKLVSEFNVIFIKLDNWIEISIGEGNIRISEKDNVIQIRKEDIFDDFKYPIQDYTTKEFLKKFINNKIIDFKLIKYNDGDDYFGIQLIFQDNCMLIFYEDIKDELCKFSTDEKIIPNNVEFL